ncbi:hypothetical protein SCP_1005000 [Sparassis crispa]|uniref:Uncharacterized protein n=1 Tax=Sparassis crispa TaxID=139825 RepID=A0A401GYL4_9APHY|nr:hypothetical protein SCP_1005000 [Sparassis crispa]GBE87253.1 hypothetical protein SCP_1005000 [Sparassis crispa]
MCRKTGVFVIEAEIIIDEDTQYTKTRKRTGLGPPPAAIQVYSAKAHHAGAAASRARMTRSAASHTPEPARGVLPLAHDRQRCALGDDAQHGPALGDRRSVEGGRRCVRDRRVARASDNLHEDKLQVGRARCGSRGGAQGRAGGGEWGGEPLWARKGSPHGRRRGASRCVRAARRAKRSQVDMSSSAVGRASPRGASELQEPNVEVGDVPDEGGVLAVAAGEAEEVLLAREAGMERASTLRALVAREGEAAGEGALAGAGVEDAVDALKGAEGEDAEVLDAGVRKLGGFVRNGCEKCAHGA